MMESPIISGWKGGAVGERNCEDWVDEGATEAEAAALRSAGVNWGMERWIRGWGQVPQVEEPAAICAPLAATGEMEEKAEVPLPVAENHVCWKWFLTYF